MILPSDVSVKLISQSKNRGLLEVSPLPTGFGHTLGNSLRRILLSQIKGAAVTQVKIKGVSHKFSNVPGVKQDVLELTLRLKQIRLKIFGDQTVVLQISKQGPGEVTAADIKTGGDCEVINRTWLSRICPTKMLNWRWRYWPHQVMVTQCVTGRNQINLE